MNFVKNLRSFPFIEDFSTGYHFQPDPSRWTVALMEDFGLTFVNENARNENKRRRRMRGMKLRAVGEGALLQDLTQDSATLTGWRRTKRSGDGKMIGLYSPGICGLRYRSFP